jgi:glycosyltransferase involved in cell wall biosynthesis
VATKKRAANRDIWPIDERAGTTPKGWPGWPEGKRFAFVLTHDVEGSKGLARVERLMQVDAKYGFRSSFNLVPEGEYRVPDELRRRLEEAGYEVGIHGLKHDGKLYFSKARFATKATRIKGYLKRWGACGFRSPLMHHNLAWLHHLGTEYDASTFDTDPFEPESDPAGTIFPFWVPGPEGRGYVELPYTLPQDFTLFGVLRESTPDIWKRKLDWVAGRGGMALMNSHPDYWTFEGARSKEEAPIELYEEFLRYVREKYADVLWNPLPRELARYYTASLPPGSRNSRKKICMITFTDYDHDGRVRRYAEALAGRGDQVDVICTGTGEKPLGEEWTGGVTVFRIQRSKGDMSGTETLGWQLVRFLVSSSILVARRHRRFRYDLVQVQGPPIILVLAAWRAKKKGAKTILDIQAGCSKPAAGNLGTSSGGCQGDELRSIERASATLADHVLVPDDQWRERLISRQVAEGKCSVVPDQADPTQLFRRDRTRNDGKFIILCGGPVQSQQGVEVAIEAFARLREKAANAELHFYCGGEGQGINEQLEQIAQRAGFDGSVKLLGKLPPAQISDLVAQADLGVVPQSADSHGNEACNTEIIRFMSRGVPVVVSRASAGALQYPEDTVRSYTAEDSGSMAEAMLELFENEVLREKLGRAGLEYADQNSRRRFESQYTHLVDSLTTERFDDFAEDPHPCA